MKLAFADVYRYVGDPRTHDRHARAAARPRLSRRSARSCIDPARAQDFGHGTPPRGGTVYLTAADEGGMMVSLIQSNYMGFGSGIVVPGTGISMQNRGTGFSLAGRTSQPGRGRQAAFPHHHSGLPHARRRAGCGFGVMGGPIQPQAHLQTLMRLIDYGANPQAVLDAPRWKVNGGISLDLESEASPALREGLAALGHQFASIPDSYMDFGAGQFVVRDDDGYVAGSDPRRDGQAAGY